MPILKSKSLIILLTAFFLTFGCRLFAQTSSTTVVVEGAAAFTGQEPVSGVRHAALADALRHAVEKAVGVTVEAETRTKNFALSHDSVSTSSNGYVKEYRILDERADAGVYRIKIEAIVAPGDSIKPLKQLCKRLKEGPNPLFKIAVDGQSGRVISAGLAKLGLRVLADSGTGGRPNIELQGKSEVDPHGEVISGTGIFAAGASVGVSVIDSASGTVLPSVDVSLEQPIASGDQSTANKLATEAASALWVQRNIPLIACALLDPQDLQIDGAEEKMTTKPSVDTGPPPTESGSLTEKLSIPGSRSAIGGDSIVELVGRLRAGVKMNPKFSCPMDVAVSRFKLIGTDDPVLADNLLEDLSTVMVKAGVFQLVERNDLDKVLQELKIQNSGLIDSGTAQKIGKLTGASAVLIGSISDRKDCFVISARLISTKTGRVQVAESVVADREPEPVVLRAGSQR